MPSVVTLKKKKIPLSQDDLFHTFTKVSYLTKGLILSSIRNFSSKEFGSSSPTRISNTLEKMLMFVREPSWNVSKCPRMKFDEIFLQ